MFWEWPVFREHQQLFRVDQPAVYDQRALELDQRNRSIFMRKLASIQSVSQIESIRNADAIERVRVLGWWVVCKKGEYAVGDQVVYCEIDALLPERPEFEFLRANCFKPAIVDGDKVVQPAGFRIRTVKIRGQVSQGICFPLSILPEGDQPGIDTDVTEQLGIRKYEPPMPVGLSGRVKGAFPSFLSKTDETRVQVLETVLDENRGRDFVMTEKLDGSSFTAFLRDGEFGICSRNLWMEEADEANASARLAKSINLKSRLKMIQAEFGFQPVVQGELIGPGVQKNKYKLKELQLHVFNLINLENLRCVDHADFGRILKQVGLTAVPEVGVLQLGHSVDELVELSIAKSVLNKDVQREGLVFRPPVEQYETTLGGRLSFKVINPKFLLKYDE